MHSKTVRVLLVAAACLGVAGVTRLTFQSMTPTLATDTTSTEDGPTAHDLILNSGYMVAVG
ncbi:MAG TPA: hypothetical protein VGD77_01910 [Gemmatimonadaceae bacterium]